MKISSSSRTPAFQPFNVTLTAETPADAARLYAIFNHPGVAAVLAGASDVDLLDAHIRGLICAGAPGADKESTQFKAILRA